MLAIFPRSVYDNWEDWKAIIGGEFRGELFSAYNDHTGGQCYVCIGSCSYW